MASHEHNQKRLQELGDSHYEIVDGQPDIRGWDVKDGTGRKIGEVDELIFDAQSRKVRYLVLDLEGNVLDLESKDVLIPIGLAELHEKDDDVILPNITIEQLRALPEYDDDDLSSETETSIRNVFSGIGSTTVGSSLSSNDTDFYSHDHFADNLHRNRNSSESMNEHVRLRQEPSYLEQESANQLDLDDDVDSERIEMDERDAVPVSTSDKLRSGNDIDEWDLTDDEKRRRNNLDLDSDRSAEERRNRPSGL